MIPTINVHIALIRVILQFSFDVVIIVKENIAQNIFIWIAVSTLNPFSWMMMGISLVNAKIIISQ
jgi:hypothetical protein